MVISLHFIGKSESSTVTQHKRKEKKLRDVHNFSRCKGEVKTYTLHAAGIN